MHPYERKYLQHDAAGFPTEATWAQANPSLFELVYQNAVVKIYAFLP
jgi:hypothetical protein